MSQEKASSNIPFCQKEMLTFIWCEVHELMTGLPEPLQIRSALFTRPDLSHHLPTRTTFLLLQVSTTLLKSEPDIFQENEGKGLTHPDALHVMSMTELMRLRDRAGSRQATKNLTESRYLSACEIKGSSPCTQRSREPSSGGEPK